MGPQSGYMGWQHGQYGGGGPPPPHSWGGHASPPPPGGMYPQRGGPPMTPDRPGPGYGAGYARGPPTPMQTPGRRGGKPTARQAPKTPDGPGGPPDGPLPPGGYQQGGWGHPGQQASQWGPQHQWGAGPPPVYSGGPPMHQPPYGGGPGMYSGGAHSPARGGVSHPRGSPEMMGNYPGGPMGGSICQTADGPEMDMYSRGCGPGHDHDDDEGSMAGGNSSKDKGRGSYKCGRVRMKEFHVALFTDCILTLSPFSIGPQCGVPKKGHVCPYQPKLTRRPGEPLPEMRGAAIQVEMDEFMTLRRLNLKIQGFPESYATEPYMDDMVVGEPHPLQAGSSQEPPGGMTRGELMPVSVDGPLQMGMPPLDTPMISSPIRSSPVTEDPIVA